MVIQSKVAPVMRTAPNDSSSKYARTEFGLPKTMESAKAREKGSDRSFVKLTRMTASLRGPLQVGAEVRISPAAAPSRATRVGPSRLPWTRTFAPLTKPAGGSSANFRRTFSRAVCSRYSNVALPVSKSSPWSSSSVPSRCAVAGAANAGMGTVTRRSRSAAKASADRRKGIWGVLGGLTDLRVGRPTESHLCLPSGTSPMPVARPVASSGRTYAVLHRPPDAAPRLAASRVRQLPLDLALGFPVRDVPALVVELLAAPEPQLQLRLASRRDVDLERDEGQALGLGLAQELVDLPAMEQQLPVPLRLMVGPVAAFPGRDVGADQPRLAPLDSRERVGEIDLARPDGLDLGPGQHDAGLHRVLDRVLVAGAPVPGDRLLGNGSGLLAVWGESKSKNAGPEGPAFGCG